MIRAPLIVAILAAVAWSSTPAATGQERITFRHYHGGEPVGVTVIEFDARRGTATERTAIDRDFGYRPLGSWTSAKSTIDFSGAVAEFALGAVKGGHYTERAGKIAPDPVGSSRSAIVSTRRFVPGRNRPNASKRRLTLLTGRPAVMFDLNFLTPLLQFCRHRRWRENFDQLRQAALIQLLRIAPDGRFEVKTGFWIQRTKEQLPLENRAIPTTVFGLSGDVGDPILVSVSDAEGALVKIELPAMGYEVRRTFEDVAPPKPVGPSLETAFKSFSRLTDQRSFGLSLRDRGLLAKVVYQVDMPIRRSVALRRPWQTFDGDEGGGRLRGTFTVTAPAFPVPGPVPDPSATPKRLHQLSPDVDVFAAQLKTRYPDPVAFIRAVEAYVASLSISYNISDPTVVFRQGLGNVTGKTRLAEALFRAERMPTRVVTGVVFTGTSFVLHRWLECHDGVGAWHALDPTIGAISALHLALGTPWLLRSQDRVKIEVKDFEFAEVKGSAEAKLRWPDGGERYYGYYKVGASKGAPPTLYGYVRTTGHRENYFDRECMRFTTDLVLDNTKLGGDGLHEFRALNIVDEAGLPVRFAIQWWGGEKQHHFIAQVDGSGATVTETGRDQADLTIEAGTILAAESFYDHWAVYFSAIDPRAVPRRQLYVLRPTQRKVFRWNLVRRQPARVTIKALGVPIDAEVLDLVEPNVRFWVSRAGVLLRLHDRANGVVVELTQPEVIQSVFGLSQRAGR